MEPVNFEQLQDVLKSFEGKEVYLHTEVNPGALLRNIRVEIEQAHLSGEGSYRLALRLRNNGWVRTESITHYSLDARGRVFAASYDEQNRIATLIQIGLFPFDFDEEAS
ncbi:YojF family protein [Paenibacillus baimaensis]|uniref:YojF family protein n=1 Tax=Paenibacillus baimaensis TaxID=2982185 RepID=UPI0021CE7D47|nr:YojF family protein [Paenibacillus sp. WQ 127069]